MGAHSHCASIDRYKLTPGQCISCCLFILQRLYCYQCIVTWRDRLSDILIARFWVIRDSMRKQSPPPPPLCCSLKGLSGFFKRRSFTGLLYFSRNLHTAGSGIKTAHTLNANTVAVRLIIWKVRGESFFMKGMQCGVYSKTIFDLI